MHTQHKCPFRVRVNAAVYPYCDVHCLYSETQDSDVEVGHQGLMLTEISVHLTGVKC